jgi:arsenate reductase
MRHDKPINVLILCTGNTARSILGEALFAHLGQGRVRAFSAGSIPSGRINPLALETLEKHGVPVPDGVRSKSWSEFAVADAPAFDFIFTVCANAAGEACPHWPGHPATVHWAIDDPAAVEPLEARRAAFEHAFAALEKRIKAFLAMDLNSLSRADVVTAATLIHEACP